jgi:hypothetical protein
MNRPNASRLVVGALAAAICTLGASTVSAAPTQWTTNAYRILTDPADNGSTSPRFIGSDAGGNTFVAGTYGGSITFGSDNVELDAVRGQVFVVSFAPNGSFRWAHRLGSSIASEIGGMAVAPNGNVAVHGDTYGATHISTPGYDRVLLTHGGWDLYTVVFGGSDGHIVWAQSDGGPGDDRGGDVTFDGFNNVYVTGSFGQTATFGTSPGSATLVSSGGADAYAASYTSAGALRFGANIAAGPQEGKGTGIAISSGAVFVIGRYTGSATVGGTTVYPTKAGAWQGLVTRLDAANGNVSWVRLVRGLTSADDGPLLGRITKATDSSLFVTGQFTDALGYGPPGYPPSGTVAGPVDTDGLVLHVQPTGQLSWMRALGSSYYATAQGVSAGPAGSVEVVGQFQGSLTLDGANLSTTGIGDVDGFVTQINSAGTVSRASAVSGPNGDGLAGVGAATGGSPVVAGVLGTNATLPGGTSPSRAGGFFATLG